MRVAIKLERLVAVVDAAKKQREGRSEGDDEDEEDTGRTEASRGMVETRVRLASAKLSAVVIVTIRTHLSRQGRHCRSIHDVHQSSVGIVGGTIHQDKQLERERRDDHGAVQEVQHVPCVDKVGQRLLLLAELRDLPSFPDNKVQDKDKDRKPQAEAEHPLPHP
eukprot:scaffold889_cov268-Pinguiococcus_pyrenoidosus.AAC.18